MTHELIERTAREWVMSDARRAARDLRRLASQVGANPALTTDELVGLAGRLRIAETRAW